LAHSPHRNLWWEEIAEPQGGILDHGNLKLAFL